MTAPLADAATIQDALADLPGWERHGPELRGSYRLPTFAAAVAFTQRIAEIAEELVHHPEWTVRYVRVELRTTTHDAGGLTALDLELARRIRDLAASAGATGENGPG